MSEPVATIYESRTTVEIPDEAPARFRIHGDEWARLVRFIAGALDTKKPALFAVKDDRLHAIASDESSHIAVAMAAVAEPGNFGFYLPRDSLVKLSQERLSAPDVIDVDASHDCIEACGERVPAKWSTNPTWAIISPLFDYSFTCGRRDLLDTCTQKTRQVKFDLEGRAPVPTDGPVSARYVDLQRLLGRELAPLVPVLRSTDATAIRVKFGNPQGVIHVEPVSGPPWWFSFHPGPLAASATVQRTSGRRRQRKRLRRR